MQGSNQRQIKGQNPTSWQSPGFETRLILPPLIVVSPCFYSCVPVGHPITLPTTWNVGILQDELVSKNAQPPVLETEKGGVSTDSNIVFTIAIWMRETKHKTNL